MLPILKNITDLTRYLDRRNASQRIDISAILKDVKDGGDKALLDLTKKLDGVALDSIRVSVQELDSSGLSNTMKSFDEAILNIQKFHQNQMPESFSIVQNDGTKTGWKWRAINRVGVYIPGGSFPLFSSLLMNAIPAQLAGVKEIAVCTPPEQNGLPNETILNACEYLGIDEIYSVGGAQAIAAFAYGTDSVKAVDKIVGPGNAYVAAAKQAVSQFVGIDMNAGPTEIVVIADENANPAYVASDLISQAEHDKNAFAILLTDSSELAGAVNEQINIQLEGLITKNIAKKSLDNHGLIFVAETLSECIIISNEIAPEHLSLQIKDSESYVDDLIAGAIFLGNKSPVAWGDYWAGPNHTLPTMGQAKFRGPLNVLDFMVPYSIIDASSAIGKSSHKVQSLAELEGLAGHANSIATRKDQ